MSEGTAGDERELAALLAVMRGAAESFRSVRATYRTRRHTERSAEAFRAEIEARQSRGAVFFVQRRLGDGDYLPPSAPETEETVRIWRVGQRCREEHHGGHPNGDYGVADGRLWWSWSELMGAATSNQDDPEVGSDVGKHLQVMLDPTPLLGSLSFRLTGRSQVAGRPTVTTHATPLPPGQRGAGFAFGLRELGIGADHYQLEIDQERGVPLAVTAIRHGQPFQEITALAIRFDDTIPAETFLFVPPDGEEVRPVRDRQRLLQQYVTVTEAQMRAPFTVLLPYRVPTDWRLNSTFVKAAKWPPSPTQISLTYRSEDGHQSIAIWQLAAANRTSFHHWYAIDDNNWHEVARDRMLVRVRTTKSGQVEAHLEQDGTLAYLVADGLTENQTATIAASLRPARSGRDSRGY